MNGSFRMSPKYIAYAIGAGAYMFFATILLGRIFLLGDEYMGVHLPALALFTYSIVLAPLTYIAALRRRPLARAVLWYCALSYVAVWGGAVGWRQYLSFGSDNAPIGASEQVVNSFLFWMIFGGLNLPPTAILYGLLLAFVDRQQERKNPSFRLW